MPSQKSAALSKSSHASDRAKLVTDNHNALRERLEAATGERITALEAVAPEWTKSRRAGAEAARNSGPGMGPRRNHISARRWRREPASKNGSILIWNYSLRGVIPLGSKENATSK